MSRPRSEVTVSTRLKLVCVALALLPSTAFAYFDPNVGSVLFQWLAPLFAVIVIGWRRLKDAIALLVHRVRHLILRRRP
jgi:hypothetical protein